MWNDWDAIESSQQRADHEAEAMQRWRQEGRPRPPEPEPEPSERPVEVASEPMPISPMRPTVPIREPLSPERRLRGLKALRKALAKSLGMDE